MKHVLAFLLSILMLGPTFGYAEDDEPRFTERKSMEDEAWLWEELSEHSPSDEVTAGVLSYFWRESQYRSDSVAGWGYTLACEGIDICEIILTRTDEGLDDGTTCEYFLRMARGRGGYGLGQWYSMHYLEHLYSFAQEYGTSIGDARMQCEFIFESLKANEELWEKLEDCNDPRRAGLLIAVYYDGTQTGAEYMSHKAGLLFDAYHEEDPYDLIKDIILRGITFVRSRNWNIPGLA